MNGKRYDSIDVIKGIAMTMVILVHYEQCFDCCKWFRYLEMGCPMFFVASGFGIASLINRRFPDGVLNKRNLKAFYASRIRALVPAWYLAILLVFAVNTILLLCFNKTIIFVRNRDGISIVCNLLFLNGFLPFCNNNVMLGAWYVGATAILYALTPFILEGMKRMKKRWMFFLLSSFAAVAIREILCSVFSESFRYEDFDYYIFLVHYPSYLLGILLYHDFSESLLSVRQTKLCLPLGILAYLAAFAVYFHFNKMYSAWTTALATYLILYYMMSRDAECKKTRLGRVLIRFGKNSFCIFLMHGFFAFTFVSGIGAVCAKVGINIRTIPGFMLLMPVVLALSYAGGVLFSRFVQRLMKVGQKKK